MEHEFFQIDILNEKGKIIGRKPRREIDKVKDIHHAAFVLTVTPTKDLILGLIPVREDLPNLYVNQYGTTMVTMRRHGESAETAARRGISRELFIDDAEPELVSEGMETFDDGRRTYVSFYILHSDMPDSYSAIDIEHLEIVSKAKFEAMIEVKPEKVAPTLRLLWKKYNSRLPL